MVLLCQRSHVCGDTRTRPSSIPSLSCIWHSLCTSYHSPSHSTMQLRMKKRIVRQFRRQVTMLADLVPLEWGESRSLPPTLPLPMYCNVPCPTLCTALHFSLLGLIHHSHPEVTDVSRSIFIINFLITFSIHCFIPRKHIVYPDWFCQLLLSVRKIAYAKKRSTGNGLSETEDEDDEEDDDDVSTAEWSEVYASKARTRLYTCPCLCLCPYWHVA